MMAKVKCKVKEAKRAKCGKITKASVRRTGHRFDSKRYCTLYTGSPDSVDVAKLVGSFKYIPEKREEILKKYENLKSRTIVR